MTEKTGLVGLAKFEVEIVQCHGSFDYSEPPPVENVRNGPAPYSSTRDEQRLRFN